MKSIGAAIVFATGAAIWLRGDTNTVHFTPDTAVAFVGLVVMAIGFITWVRSYLAKDG
jgi:hypothetical protein